MAKEKARIKVELPKGFKAITGGGFHTWDFEAEPVIQGSIVKFGETPSKYKGKPPQKYCVISTTKGERTVWESAALAPLFDCKKGKEVFISFDGRKKIPGRDKPMKLFTVATR